MGREEEGMDRKLAFIEKQLRTWFKLALRALPCGCYFTMVT